MPSASADSDNSAPALRRLILRNTLFLTVAQAVSLPLSILLNAVTARYLGAAALGSMYLATTFNSFGFLAVEWGQAGVVPALVAMDRTRAGLLLGTSLIWRMLSAAVVYWALTWARHLLGYGPEFQPVLALVFAGYTLSTLVNAYQAAILGFERTDIAAYRQVGEQVVAVLFVLPILLLGGKLNATLIGHACVMLPVLGYVAWALRSTGVDRLSFQWSALRALLVAGTPFVFFNLAMVLQPNIDAVFLSKLASVDVVGWHAAARKLVGLLVFPVTALAGALYPTLCRLQATDPIAFRQAARSALRGSSLLGTPVALGCALYPELGISIYSRASFQPAEDNLRLLSIFLFLLYITIPLGICILAAGLRKQWAVVQSLCVVVSVLLDPVLVPWFQQRTNNGGLGICVAAIISELVVVAFGVMLAPRGVFDRAFWRSQLLVLTSGAGMIATARVLHTVTPFLAAPIAISVYVGLLWLTGGLDKSLVEAALGFVAGRLRPKA